MGSTLSEEAIMNINKRMEEERKMQEERQRNFMKKIYAGIAVLLVIFLLVNTIVIIPEGRIGAKYRFGQVVSTDLAAGLHAKVPFIESVKRVDITEQVYESDLTAYTKDTQSVESMSTKVNYYLNGSQLSTIIKSIGVNNVESKLIAPTVTATIKNQVGQYKAEDLIAYRSELQSKIEEALTEELGNYGVVITSVNIQDITFVSSFEAVVEAKVAAEQEARKVQNETIKKEEEAKQQVIAAQAEADAIRLKAEAEAEANRLINASLTNTLVEYEKVQKWNGEFPEVMGNTVNPFVTIGD